MSFASCRSMRCLPSLVLGFLAYASIFPAAALAQNGEAKVLTLEQERALKVGDSFKECDRCPEMVVVPAGSFLMGSPETELGRESTEGPQRRVTFARPFAVGKFAVTFEQWDACAADNGCLKEIKDQGWGRGKQPVININSSQARSYVEWLTEFVAWFSKRTEKTYRLLSEAEREYVTRAGTTTPFWWGSSISTGQANYDGTKTYGSGGEGEFRQKTVPVDSFAPNPWGLYQVHGNIFEWVQDCWHDNYGGAPADGSAWRDQEGCSRGVLRGGAWDSNPALLRSASRKSISFSTGEEVRIFRRTYPVPFSSSSVGFRVARTLAY